MNLNLQTSDFELHGNTQPLVLRDRPACANLKSEIKNQKSLRHGMTLIELLIVITILTTLVAGVIPLLSPNNDERKITTAARSFQTYLNLAKAKAARTGRPHGIAIVESSPGSGVALEVFGLEVPPPFAGFSTASGVRVIRETVPDPNQAGRYFVHHYLQFVLSDTRTVTPPSKFPPEDDYAYDLLPPGFMSRLDTIVVGGITYQLIDQDYDGDGDDDPNYEGPVYTRDTNQHQFATYEVKVVSDFEVTLPFVIPNYPANGNRYTITAPKPFQIIRQPANSSESPFQFPAGIGIDMQASVATGDNTLPSGYARFPSGLSLYTNRGSNPATSDYIGIMFSPSGSVSNVSLNGTVLGDTVRIAMLIGRVENAGIDPALKPWIVTNPNDKEEVKEKQDTINWLNLDSRILSIVAGSGRSVVNETAFVNFDLADGSGGDADGDDELIKADADDQINAAYEFAREMNAAK